MSLAASAARLARWWCARWCAASWAGCRDVEDRRKRWPRSPRQIDVGLYIWHFSRLGFPGGRREHGAARTGRVSDTSLSSCRFVEPTIASSVLLHVRSNQYPQWECAAAGEVMVGEIAVMIAKWGRLVFHCWHGFSAAMAGVAFLVVCGYSGDLAAADFHKTKCWFEIPRDREMTCGSLHVPENRGKDSTAEIALATVIFQPDRERYEPVVFLSGGPGQAAGIGTREELEG